MNREKYPRDKQEPRKSKKSVNKEAQAAKEQEKRKPKNKRDELMNAAKNVQPTVVMPF